MELKRKNKYLYNSLLLKKFVNNLAKKGKVQKIEISLFKSLAFLKFKVKLNPLLLFLFLINEIKPVLELKTLRLGSVSYKIPVPLLYWKQVFRAVKLLLKVIKLNTQKLTLVQKVYLELFLILQKKSSIYKLNQSIYQTASSNRAFSHYR